MVTLIIPPDRKFQMPANASKRARSAANIKSKGTRKNVQGAIESTLSTLARFKDAGENGLAIFVGSVIIGNNYSKMVNIVVQDPPQPLLRLDIDVIQP